MLSGVVSRPPPRWWSRALPLSTSLKLSSGTTWRRAYGGRSTPGGEGGDQGRHPAPSPHGRASSPLPPVWRCPQGPATPIQMYNSITHQIEPLRRSGEGALSWYACGPTVYDHSHVGHARCYLTQDIIMRLLRSLQVDTFYAMGLTDVDDKIIAKARALPSSSSSSASSSSPDSFHSGDEHEPTPIQRVARPFEASFWEDMEALGVERPHAITRVSEHMASIQGMIQRLVQAGHAYEAPDGSIYFDTDHYRHTVAAYPVPTRSRLTLDDLAESAEPTPHKKHVADFALWKASPPSEAAALRALGAEWTLTLPNGRTVAGRPGWHIECSAMCEKLFGPVLDVHAGGIDLLFPHHCNEVAQSQAFLAQPDEPHPQWPHYFLHVGHVYIQGAKMSKSLKNFITIKDFLREGHTPTDLRWFCLLHHYRAHVEFGPDRVENARSTHTKVSHFLQECAYHSQAHPAAFYWEEGPQQDRHLYQQYHQARQAIRQAHSHDFDTPTAVQALLTLIKAAHVRWASRESPPVPVTLLHHLRGLVHSTLHTWGLALDPQEPLQASLSSSPSPAGASSSSSPPSPASQADPLLDRLVACRLQLRQLALDPSLLSSDSPGKAQDDSAEPSEGQAPPQHGQGEVVNKTQARGDMKGRLLALSDEIRDGLLAEGVEIKDRQLEASSWRRLRPEEREQVREGSPMARQQRAHQKAQQQAPPASPAELLREWRESGRFAHFDGEGLPTHDADGTEISKSRRRKLAKQWEKQQRQYRHYLSSMKE